MRINLNSLGKRRLSATLLLVALLFRAYVPVGFMPAGGNPWLLALCPEGLSAPMPAHHDHHPSSPGHNHFEHCPFGSAPGSGPVSATLTIATSAPITVAPLTPDPLPPFPVRLSRAHLPRGPPAVV